MPQYQQIAFCRMIVRVLILYKKIRELGNSQNWIIYRIKKLEIERISVFVTRLDVSNILADIQIFASSGLEVNQIFSEICKKIEKNFAFCFSR